MRWTRRRVAAAVGVAALVASVAFASAANLPLAAQSMTAAELTHPCPGTATAVPADRQSGDTYLAVALTLPPGCANLLVQLQVDRPSGNNRTGSGTTDANGQVTIPLNRTYDATEDNVLIATVGGWELTADWWVDPSPYIWCTVVDASGAACAATVTIFTGNKPGGGTATYYDVVVTTTSAAYVQWEVTFALDHLIYGTRPTRLGNSTLDGFNDGGTNWNGTTNSVTRQSACAAIPLLSVRGNDTGGANTFRDVRNDRERRFSLVVNINQNGYFDVLSPGCT